MTVTPATTGAATAATAATTATAATNQQQQLLQRQQQLRTQQQSKNKGKASSLCSLLRYFVDLQLIVELKTGRMYKGILQQADSDMSMTLENATLLSPSNYYNTKKRTTRQQRPEKAAERCDDPTTNIGDDNVAQEENVNHTMLWMTMQIRGSSIRYIHFPDTVDLTAIIKHGMDREKSALNRYKRGVRK